tara:strand:- start:2701 stop:2931 length:231 start_codon:yes stop_codon:yes gene_type:complete
MYVKITDIYGRNMMINENHIVMIDKDRDNVCLKLSSGETIRTDYEDITVAIRAMSAHRAMEEDSSSVELYEELNIE